MFRRLFSRNTIRNIPRAAPIVLAGIGVALIPHETQAQECQTIKAKCKESPVERTFIAIKPDGVQRGLVGEIIKRFENKGFRLVALKLVQPGREHLEKHYEDLNQRPFFAGLVDYMNSGPIVAMVWEGQGVVKTGRVMLGTTNPADSAPGTIRGDYSIQVGRNICHGSDSVESAQHEIGLWFTCDELQEWTQTNAPWIHAGN